MDPVFVNGLPLRINAYDFRRGYLQSFPRLRLEQYDQLIESAIDTVYTIFAGVQELWVGNDEQVYFDKTRTCYLLLLAWYIADTYPMLTAGVPTLGGVPVVSKNIGGVKVTFSDLMAYEKTHGALVMLRSNVFGRNAYLMLTGAAKKHKLRNANGGMYGRP